MIPLAHSARPEKRVSAQPYQDHVEAVVRRAMENVVGLAGYSPRFGGRLLTAVRQAAEFHDLGKLAPPNQNVLASGSGKKSLPINHVDAGTAWLLQQTPMENLGACLVMAHHRGLPNMVEQSNQKEGFVFRDINIKPDVDTHLNEYIEEHHRALAASTGLPDAPTWEKPPKMTPLAFRLALSCLVDADHQDTADHYGEGQLSETPPLEPERRIERLDRYVKGLSEERDERNQLRALVYDSCRNAALEPSMYACDAPVGSGKTTAIMAHLLKAAAAKDLRRIVVVLPFTNIIDQSVRVYRRALTAPKENVEETIGAHHHRAEFQHPDSRHLSYLWKPPIVVTTAVQFFETLASSSPAALRKLHCLPGSAIFIDEAHAALPAHLWPLAWKWLKGLARDWGCHLVLGSGSLNRFWELEEFSSPPDRLPDLMPNFERTSLMTYDRHRVKYGAQPEAMSIESLIEWIRSPAEPGPKLVIVNTVQSAAVIAARLAEYIGRDQVEHLSTALCPDDRGHTLDRVIQRLKCTKDDQWVLVATSCVEAGVDLSFRTGFRERSSLNSLLQTGGRVNRQGKFSSAMVWDFTLKNEGLVKANPGLKTSVSVLSTLFAENKIGPEYSTLALQREIRFDTQNQTAYDLMTGEKQCNFPFVEKEFHVIDSNTVTAVVKWDLVERLNRREKITANEIMSFSVQIPKYRTTELALEELRYHSGLYEWKLDYNDFLGYMAGVIAILSATDGAYYE